MWNHGIRKSSLWAWFDRKYNWENYQWRKYKKSINELNAQRYDQRFFIGEDELSKTKNSRASIISKAWWFAFKVLDWFIAWTMYESPFRFQEIIWRCDNASYWELTKEYAKHFGYTAGNLHDDLGQSWKNRRNWRIIEITTVTDLSLWTQYESLHRVRRELFH